MYSEKIKNIQLKIELRILIAIIVFLGITKNLYAQPDRQWSVSFNTEASMLSGAVVGGNSDITSLYFNPAGISEIEDQKLVLNANLFKFDYESYNGYMGDETESQDYGFRVQPRFVSYTMRSKKAKKLSFQIAVFNRNYDNKSIYAQTQIPSNFYENKNENTIKNYDYKSEYSDYWGGIGTSYQITDKFTVGLSLLGSTKSFNYDKNLFVIIYSNPNGDEGPHEYSYKLESYERIIMYDVRLLAKIGLKYTTGNWSFGTNITLPSVHVLGNADVKRKIEYLENPGNGSSVHTGFRNEFAQYRTAQFKDPFSISLGSVFYSKNKKFQYYFTTEFFKGQDTYFVIDGKNTNEDVSEYPAGTNFSSYKYGTKDIINFAVGYKHILSDNFDLILGAKTDFNAYSVSNEGEFENINEIDEVPTNLYYFTLGSNFNYKRASFIFGVETSYGYVKDAESLMKINGFDEYLVIKNNTMDYMIISLGIFLGFTINF